MTKPRERMDRRQSVAGVTLGACSLGVAKDDKAFGEVEAGGDA